MPVDPKFPARYSQGTSSKTVAVLCEGDVGGYEDKILGAWGDKVRPGGMAVDIRPCGTGDGLFAVADAIGRTVRVVVLEDRDFRSVEQAAADCTAKRDERESRGIAMRGWMTWRRNEIENYFLDHEVLSPAMCETFGCKDADVQVALDAAKKAVVVFQSVKMAVGHALASSKSIQTGAEDDHKAWAELVTMLKVGGGAPKWSAAGPTPPEAAKVRVDLERKIKGVQKKAFKNGQFQEPLLGQSLLSKFDECVKEWINPDVPDAIWKSVWAGKEILKLVRQGLATKFPVHVFVDPSRIDKGTRLLQPVEWHKIGEGKAKDEALEEQESLDRDIELAAQSTLIKHLWTHLDKVPTADMNADFADLAMCFVA